MTSRAAGYEVPPDPLTDEVMEVQKASVEPHEERNYGAFYAYGKETVKTLPLPGVESNVISPFNSVIER
jgi:hypothetical protein